MSPPSAAARPGTGILSTGSVLRRVKPTLFANEAVSATRDGEIFWSICCKIAELRVKEEATLVVSVDCTVEACLELAPVDWPCGGTTAEGELSTSSTSKLGSLADRADAEE